MITKLGGVILDKIKKNLKDNKPAIEIEMVRKTLKGPEPTPLFGGFNYTPGGGPGGGPPPMGPSGGGMRLKV